MVKRLFTKLFCMAFLVTLIQASLEEYGNIIMDYGATYTISRGDVSNASAAS